ncbi:hypothetical protein ACETQG_11750 (plasmid) [Weissella cibaria]
MSQKKSMTPCEYREHALTV